jgi:hypothetical protein
MKLVFVLSICAVLISGCQVTVGGSMSKSYSTGMSDDRRP